MAHYDDWLKRAKSSLELAQAQVIHYIQYEDLCYQAQQAVEKALKGLLIYYNTEPELTHNTHNIAVLLRQIKACTDTDIPDEIKEAAKLTMYAVFTLLKQNIPENMMKLQKRNMKTA